MPSSTHVASRWLTATALVLYHGAQRWNGPPSIVPHRKGQAEHGPGIYLTTSWQTAQRYGKGGGSIYRMTLTRPRRWAENHNFQLDEAIAFTKTTLGRGKRGKDVIETLEVVSNRMGGGTTVPAFVLINSFVNNNVSVGQNGVKLAEFLVKHQVDASHVHHSGEDWIVVFNPRIINNVEKLNRKELDDPDFAWDLPRVTR